MVAARRVDRGGVLMDHDCADNQWFDRTLCQWCGEMHYYCTECGDQLDDCDAPLLIGDCIPAIHIGVDLLDSALRPAL